MYLRVTERRNRDGSSVAYYALAENVWNAQAKRSEAQVIHNFGRADQLDKATLQRLLASIQRIIDADAAGAIASRGKASLPDIAIDAVFEFGVVLAARALWEELGIGEAIRTRLMRAQLSAPHEVALLPWRGSASTSRARNWAARRAGCPISPGCRRQTNWLSTNSI